MGKFLYNLTIMPIQYIIDVVFSALSRFFDSYGIAIIGVSFVVQLLVFPLYKRSDAIQEAEREKQKSMEKWVKHIRKTFKGSERFMMLSTYYRQQNYKPIYALKGSVSLLLQIPFFLAAYNFLSNLPVLSEQSFLFLRELSKPDALISIGSITVNVMPILMTVINILSGMIYTKGFSFKEKAQLYGMAGLFLIILYNSPSGLVLYWTMNNLFSLLKNIVTKCFKNPRRVVNISSAVLGVAFLVYKLGFSSSITLLEIALSVVIVLAGFTPLILSVLSSKRKSGFKTYESDGKLFLVVSLFLSLFTGLMIPLSVVKASPAEFAIGQYLPLELVFSSFAVMTGFFAVWGNVYYRLGTQKTKKLFLTVFIVLSIVFVVDFFFFGTDMGTISTSFVFDNGLSFSIKQQVINLIVLFAVSLPLVLIVGKKPVYGRFFYLILTVAVLGYAVVSSMTMDVPAPQKEEEIKPVFNMNKNGKNVVVLMLDRAISGYIPFIMNEKPELAEAYSDFIYYPNTLSFGTHTNLGAPALFGGYEYTPLEMDRRDSEKLVDKHDEALLVLPVLFRDNGYEVTVCDPSWAGYHFIPDLSIYSEYPGIKAYNLSGKYSYIFGNIEETRTQQRRSIVFYSFMKGLPLAAQSFLYDDGDYWASSSLAYTADFIKAASSLKILDQLTSITDSSNNTLLLMTNDTTHSPLNLTYPDYKLNVDVNDTTRNPDYLYDAAGNVLDLTREDWYTTYDVNMYALIQIANWMNYLKENGVYDNTRIIIVSDHGEWLAQFDYMVHSDGLDVQALNPVLMFKDFDSHQTSMKTVNDFMTNGDTPYLVVRNLIDNPVNPFTGKTINNSEKTAHPQVITTSRNWGTENVTSNVFDTSDGKWYSVHDNIFVKENWEEYR